MESKQRWTGGPGDPRIEGSRRIMRGTRIIAEVYGYGDDAALMVRAPDLLRERDAAWVECAKLKEALDCAKVAYAQVAAAHDELSEALEEDVSNDAIRDAALRLCLSLCDYNQEILPESV